MGYNDTHLHLLQNKFDTLINVRGDNVTLKGDSAEIDQIEKIFHELSFILTKNGALTPNDVATVIDVVSEITTTQEKQKLPTRETESIILLTSNSIIKAKNESQKKYVEAVKKNEIVFAIGPAGTGKTFLAVAMAIASLKNREVNKIVLARPAVEAGESLGFLPGDLKDKIDPYLRPLYDALDDMLPPEKLKNYMERKVIEIMPLAYMRGRTIHNSFVILDEAQNATSMQMKMFLTRIGVNSRAIITGDDSQIDLPSKIISGLVQIQEVIKSIEGISFVRFTSADVTRHRLVKEIIDAYSNYKKSENGTTN